MIEESTNYYEYQTKIVSFEVTKTSYSNEIAIEREGYTYGDERTQTVLSGYTGDLSYVKYYYNFTDSNENGTNYTDEDILNAGTYYIYAVIEEHGNYNEYVTKTSIFVIEKLTHSDISLVINDSYTYGDVITPNISKEMEVKVDYLYGTEDTNDGGNLFTNETKLSVGTYYMYALIYGDNNVNSYTTKQVMFVVSPIEVDKPIISDVKYNGNPQTALVGNTYYNVTNATFTDAGEYLIVVNLKDTVNYVWKEDNNSNDLNLTFNILKLEMSAVDVEILTPSYDYDGTAKTPEISVTLNGVVVYNGEYSVSYENNVNAGNASVILTAIENGNFTGTKSCTFTINKIDYEDLTIYKPSFSFGYSSECELSNDVYGDVTLYYSINNSNIGGTVLADDTVLGVGKYYVYAEISESQNYNAYTTLATPFEVFKANFTGAVIVLEDTIFSYTGREIKPIIVSVELGNYVITSDDYIVSYENNIEEGTATLIITATETGNFIGTASVNFTIEKLNLDLAVITFENDIDEFYYTGESITPTIFVKIGGETLVLGSDYSIENLDNINAGTATMIITGMGQFTGTRVVTFTILGVSLEDAVVYFKDTNTTTNSKYMYTGNNLTSKVNKTVVVVYNGVEIDSSNITISWSKDGKTVKNIKDAGTYTGEIVAPEGGNFVGTASTKLTLIVSGLVIDSTNIDLITLLYSELSYTGSNLINSAKVVYNGNQILYSKDCSVVWKDSNGNVVTEIVEVGEYTAEITILNGNYSYSGVITRTLTVK